MYKTEGFDAKLVTYKNTEQYTYLDKEVKGLKIDFIPNRGRFLYFEIAILKYLFTCSGNIDVLNLFHFKKDNILYLLVYKILNPKGKTYIKLDIDLLFFKNYNAFLYSKYSLKNYFLKALTKTFFKLTDYFSVESDQGRDYLIKIYPELEKKLICIPNGIDNYFIDKEVAVRNFHEKENLIITVGRIGTNQKNTELLMEALQNSSLQGWNVYIIGPIEKNFQEYINVFFKYHPHLIERIKFTGNITDRKQLLQWYNRAKIFCLTSRTEGFPIAFSEALYFGNYIITTPVSSANHITNNGEYGAIVNPDPKELARAFENAIEPGYLNQQRYDGIRSFAKESFTWETIIQHLSEKLRN
jgi:glycosyltransferase involved in cell wall biosynthesis